MSTNFDLVRTVCSNSDLIPAVVGGVIGALAGGIPAWLLARRGSKESLRRDQNSRKEAELAASSRIFTKLSMMVNDLASTLIQIEQMLARPVDPQDESPTQRRVSAFAGASAEFESFTADELSVLVAANQTDYLTDLDLFGRRYCAFLRTLHAYGELKSKLHELLSDSEEIEFGQNDIIRTKVTAKNAGKLRMQARTLESVIVPLIDGLRHDTELGVKLARQYGPIMKKHFGAKKIPFFDFSDLKTALPNLAIEETSLAHPDMQD